MSPPLTSDSCTAKKASESPSKPVESDQHGRVPCLAASFPLGYFSEDAELAGLHQAYKEMEENVVPSAAEGTSYSFDTKPFYILCVSSNKNQRLCFLSLCFSLPNVQQLAYFRSIHQNTLCSSTSSRYRKFRCVCQYYICSGPFQNLVKVIHQIKTTCDHYSKIKQCIGSNMYKSSVTSAKLFYIDIQSRSILS